MMVRPSDASLRARSWNSSRWRGIRAVQRFIKHKDGRVVDERGGEPHALSHPA